MKKMFCIRCNAAAFGRTNFCSRCLSEQYDLFRVESQTVRACKICGLYEVATGKWSNFKNDEEAVMSIVKNSIKPAGEITKTSFDMRSKGGEYFIKITATGLIDIPNSDDRIEKTETREMAVVIKKVKCDVCAKMSGNYYEAVLQLRGQNKDKLMESVKQLADKREITTIEEKREGYDVFVMFKKNAKKIAGMLKKRRIAKNITKSYKLKCEKKGKKLYRDYYAIR